MGFGSGLDFSTRDFSALDFSASKFRSRIKPDPCRTLYHPNKFLNTLNLSINFIVKLTVTEFKLKVSFILIKYFEELNFHVFFSFQVWIGFCCLLCSMGYRTLLILMSSLLENCVESIFVIFLLLYFVRKIFFKAINVSLLIVHCPPKIKIQPVLMLSCFAHYS